MQTKSPVPLTLIVAATKSLGIGNAGKLPWPQLKQEMAYFSRVTKRLPSGTPETAKNAVIMGRKTWDSIPEKFRPLKGRLNVVVSRSVNHGATASPELHADLSGPLYCTSLEEAVQVLRRLSDSGLLGRAFVIGGGSIYAEALKLEESKNILLTRIFTDYDCDTFFPIDLDSARAQAEGWLKKDTRQLGEFVGEDMTDPRREEGEVVYEFCLFEKQTIGSG